MPGNEWERILREIAKANHITVEKMQQEMLVAMEQGRSNPDPAVQQRWAQILPQNEELTLGEFLDFLLEWVTGGCFNP